MHFSGRTYLCECHPRGFLHRGGQVRAEPLERAVIGALVAAFEAVPLKVWNTPKRAESVDSMTAQWAQVRAEKRRKEAELFKLQKDAAFLDSLKTFGEARRKEAQQQLDREIVALSEQEAKLRGKSETAGVSLPPARLDALRAAGGLAAFLSDPSNPGRREFLRLFVSHLQLAPVPDGRRNTPFLTLSLRPPLGDNRQQSVPIVYNAYQRRTLARKGRLESF
jgi:hypothetical protein